MNVAMRTSIVTMRVIVAMLALQLCGVTLAADKPEALPPGMAKYVMILWRPGSPLPGNPSPGNVTRADEPDVVKLGGKVLHKRDNQRVIILTKQAARQLRKHEAVFLLQRLWVGESLNDWDESPMADSRFDSTTDDGSAIETDDTNLQWGPKNYTYDQSGNITAIGADTYTYDTAGRLARSEVGGQTETYEYDSFGNLLKTEITGRTAVTIPVDSGSNRLAGREYDAAGNVLSAPLRDRSSGWTSGMNSYTWDGLNRLSYIRGPVTQRRMIYDANDEKISTWILTGSNETPMHWTVRDSEGRPLREFTSRTSFFGMNDLWIWQQDHVYGEGTLVGGETPEWGGSDILPEVYGGRRHVHLDHLGSVRMVTNDQHKSLSEHDYYPFGITQTPTHQEDITFGVQVEPTIDSFRFAGHQRDFLGWVNVNTTEYLDYMHARVYDPNLGRFLSVDPGKDWDMSKPQSWNMYSYVRNNPINATDPDGRVGFILLPPTMPFRLGLNLPKNETVRRLERIAVVGGVTALIVVLTRGEALFAPRAKESEPPRPRYAPRDGSGSPLPLPTDRHGNATPDPAAEGRPHTQLGTRTEPTQGEDPYLQSRTWDGNGQAGRRIDNTDHNDPGRHPNPHQHPIAPSGKKLPLEPVPEIPPKKDPPQER